MGDRNHAPVCGIYCGSCKYLGEQCKGCGHVGGKPFWSEHVPGGVCFLHDCCSVQRKLEHCGLCGDFPCMTFLQARDPEMSDEQFKASVEARQEALRRRSKVGTEQWLEEVGGEQ